MKKWRFALYIGFYAGLVWGFVGWLFYYLRFTSVPTGFWLEPFYKHAFIYRWYGHLAGVAAFIVVSLLAALLYAAALSKQNGPWPGVVYGFVWWVLIFGVVGPLSGMVPPIRGLSLDSLITETCLFLLWGVFIGYSITLEFTDERKREPAASTS